MQKKNFLVTLNREDKTDLSLLRKLLVICQKSCKLSFWKVTDSLSYSKKQVWLLQELFFNKYLPAWTSVYLKKIYSVGENERSHLYKQWQQHKQLKTMEMMLDLIFTMRDVCISSNLDQLTKFHRTTKFKDIALWNISQMIKKAVPINTGVCPFVSEGVSMKTETTAW